MTNFIIEMKGYLPNGLDEIGEYLTQHPNSSIVIQCHALGNYRPVTEEEKKKHDKPECACVWIGQKFLPTPKEEGWSEHLPHFVPIDFVFKKRRKPTIKETSDE